MPLWGWNFFNGKKDMEEIQMKENQTFEKIFGPYKDKLTDKVLRK